MIKCPECQTVQTTSSPFCENCGYRLRSQATIVEGIAAIVPEAVRQGIERADRVDTAEHAQLGHHEVTSPEELGPLPPRPRKVKQAKERPQPTLTDTAAIPALAPERSPAATTATTAPQAPLSANAAEPAGAGRRGRATAEERTSVSSLLTRPSELSGLHAQPAHALAPRVGLDRVAMFAGSWAIITALGVLAAYFVITHDPHSPHRPTTAAASPMRVAIPAGVYLRGLDESTRAFILRACLRVADLPDEECEQERLLAGEYPQESIHVPAFWIDDREATVAQYQACVDQGACAALSYKDCKVYTPQGLQIALRVPKHLTQPEQPVTCLTRQEAQAFCAHRGGALPSHDQWEKAARGVDGQLFAWGSTWDPLVANWGEVDVIKTVVSGKIDGFAWTAPPGQFDQGKSPYGLLDVAGNVAEWVSGESLQGHVRGGSWTSDPFALRTTVRKPVRSTERRTDVGVRCAYDRASP